MPRPHLPAWSALRLSHVLLPAAFVLLALCALPAQAEKIPVFVSIAPQKFFVERIGGDTVDVSVMVQPGASPHTYEPRPRQMTALAGTRLYFSIGVTFEEAWLPRIRSASPKMRIVAMDAGITKLMMEEHSHDEDAHGHAHDKDHGHAAAASHGHAAETPGKHDEDAHGHDHGHEHAAVPHGHDHDHDHENAHDHDHTGPDPHVWLSPLLAKQMAHTIADTLSEAAPERADFFRANLAAFEQELDTLHNELLALFAPIPPEKRIFMVFHPSWGYFAHTYGLTQISIEYEGREPTPRIMARLMEESARHGIRTVFIQPQFSRKSAETIASHIKGHLVVADPLDENWMENMRAVGKLLAQSFTQE